MATRHNLCINPAVGVSVSGWAGGGTPVQTAVSGFGRGSAARYTSGTFISTAATASGAVTVGLTYTCSIYLRAASFNVPSGVITIEWINAGGGGFGYPNTSYALTSGVVGRAVITAVAPTNAVACRLIVEGTNMASNAVDATMLLIEQVGALDTYFDGDTSPGGSWDGTTGLSASTLVDATGVAVTARIGLAVVSSASARKSAPATGRTAGAGYSTAVARKAAPATGRGHLAGTSASTARKLAPAAVLTPLAGMSLATARKVTAASGRSTAAVWSYRSQVVSRAVGGYCGVLLVGGTSARKVTPAAGRSNVAAAATSSTVRHSAVSASVHAAVAGRAQSSRVTPASARVVLALAASGTVRKAAPATGNAHVLVAAVQLVQPPAPTRGVMRGRERQAASATERERTAVKATGRSRRGPAMTSGGGE